MSVLTEYTVVIIHHIISYCKFATFKTLFAELTKKPPPPIKPKKRYISSQVTSDVIQDQINESLNTNKTFNLPQTPFQLKVQSELDSSIQLVNTNEEELCAQKQREGLERKDTNLETVKMNLLEAIAQELETRFVCVRPTNFLKISKFGQCTRSKVLSNS